MSILETLVPVPTCIGFLPPSPPDGANADLIVCDNSLAKFTREDLKPDVFKFARLSPITFNATCEVFKPDIPATSDDVDITYSFLKLIECLLVFIRMFISFHIRLLLG